MTAREKRPDPRPQRTIDALVAAAEELFRDNSYDDVTLEQLAERAGVGVVSIYNHFGSKAGLYAAIVERALDIDRDYMDRAYTPERDPLGQVRAAAREYVRFGLEHPHYFRMLAFPSDPGPFPAAQELSARLARRVAEQNDRLVDALRRGTEEGLFDVEDPEATATFLWASCNGCVALSWRTDALRPSRAQLRRILRVAERMVERGLAPTGG